MRTEIHTCDRCGAGFPGGQHRRLRVYVEKGAGGGLKSKDQVKDWQGEFCDSCCEKISLAVESVLKDATNHRDASQTEQKKAIVTALQGA